jgi:hypothetical protein
VDNDPGKAPVRVPGRVRLVLELVYFGFAVWALIDAGAVTAGWILGGTVIVHYLLSLDRVIWLLKQWFISPIMCVSR